MKNNENILITASNIPQAKKLFDLVELLTEDTCIEKPFYYNTEDYGIIRLEGKTIHIVANHNCIMIKGLNFDKMYNFSNVIDTFLSFLVRKQ